MAKQLTLESLQQTLTALEKRVQQMEQALIKAGLSKSEEGVVGVYEGEFMVTTEGQRIQVPANYASKTMLVSGDSLRMIEAKDGGRDKFKQINKMERSKAEGLLARKDGKFEVLTDQGSFKVLAASVKHYDGQPGDTVLIQFATNHTKGSWAAIEKIVRPQPAGELASPVGVVPLPTVNTIRVQHAPVEGSVKPQPAKEQIPSEPMTTGPEPTTETVIEAPKADKASKGSSHTKREAKSDKRGADQSAAKDEKSAKKSERSDKLAASSRTKSKKKSGDRSSSTERTEVATKPNRPAAKEEKSLPLDQGEIAPAGESDDDDLM